MPIETVTLNFRKFGENNTTEPLIILHGLLGSQSNLSGIAKALCRQRTVYNLDLRNHGESPHHPAMSLRDMAADIAAFMHKQHIESCLILGHSMGGKVAMQLALDQPELINSLIVADIAPKRYPPRHDDVFAALETIEKANIRSRSEADELIKPIIIDQASRLFLLSNLICNDTGHFVWRMNVAAISNNYLAISAAPATDIGTNFDKPSLFIAGSKSPYIKESDFLKIKELFPQAKIEYLNAGHWLHIDQSKQFVELVFQFFTKRDTKK